MDEERLEAEAGEQQPKRARRYRTPLKFCAVLLVTCALAAGLLWLLAWVCFRMRFSSEVIRAGIMGLYVIPCLIGGRVIKKLGFLPAIVWGMGLGVAFYGVLFALSWLTQGMRFSNSVSLTVPILCVASGLLGTLLGRRKRKTLPEDPAGLTQDS